MWVLPFCGLEPGLVEKEAARKDAEHQAPPLLADDG